MAKNYGFFEFTFANDSILTGTYGNNANLGEVFPEMASKITDLPGLAGRYVCFWLELETESPYRAELVIEQLGENPRAFRLGWVQNGTPTFTGVGNLLAPDRFVGYYEWD